jgi:archaemetzincin
MSTNPSDSQICSHKSIRVDPSTHASKVGYKRPTEQQRVSATVAQSSKANSNAATVPKPATFPGALVLPGDDLALDPKCPAQSLRQWLRLEERNPVTSDRDIVYVAAPPAINSEVDFMRGWTSPNLVDKADDAKVKSPKIKDIVDYLTAYYHGMSVKNLPSSTLKFASWDSAATASTKGSKGKTEKKAPRYVGLNTTSECVRIRTRASNDRIFDRQLNLDDLLDAAISILPEDAYALVLLVDHDLYESAEDEFVCGRAYGGSRVAVISSARYNPLLDAIQGIERDHAWPASHCEAYVGACCDADASQPAKKRVKVTISSNKQKSDQSSSLDDREHVGFPIHAALIAHQSLPSLDNSPPNSQLDGLWLGRVCRTAAHELGHCFGMDHCTYYACSMQGSASLKEDARQPPYLCPIDLAKMISATETTPGERYRAILAFCAKHEGVHLFDAFRAWIGGRLEEFADPDS